MGWLKKRKAKKRQKKAIKAQNNAQDTTFLNGLFAQERYGAQDADFYSKQIKAYEAMYGRQINLDGRDLPPALRRKVTGESVSEMFPGLRL